MFPCLMMFVRTSSAIGSYKQVRGSNPGKGLRRLGDRESSEIPFANGSTRYNSSPALAA